MKKIISVDLTRGRNAEHFQFHTNALAFLTADFAALHKISDLQSKYAALFKYEDDLYAQLKAYELTQDLDAKDRVRDDIFIYVKQTIAAHLYSPVVDKKTAAQKLDFALAPYKHADSKPAAENTALVINALQMMESDAYKGYVTELGLTDTLPLLKKANDDFNTLYISRSDVKLGRVSNDNMKTARTKTDEAYRTLVSAVNALYQVNELVTHDAAAKTSLEKAIDSTNALINQFAETLSLRGAGKKPSIPGEDPDPLPDPKPDPNPDENPDIL
jgi:Family of unknown function (DUF6261)